MNESLLERAARLIRLPDADGTPAKVEKDGLRCPVTGRAYPMRDGVLDLLDPAFAPTPAQRMLDFRLAAWFYDRLRGPLTRLFSMPSFEREAADVIERLSVGSGDAVLDVACGHGNFTVALARHVGPEGLVVGLDIADAMLRRAVDHAREAGVSNLLLIRGDALALPFFDASFDGVNCSGGIHQIPDLAKAVREFARVGIAGAGFSASGFASPPGGETRGRRLMQRGTELRAVDLGWLCDELRSAGYDRVDLSMPSGSVGYVWGVIGGDSAPS